MPLAFVVENLRLKDLVEIVGRNEAFFHEFSQFLRQEGYATVHAFVNEPDSAAGYRVLLKYLSTEGTASVYDGIGNEYDSSKAKWYFIAWLFRDAPAQRLNPLIKSQPGRTVAEKRAHLLNVVRQHVAPLFPSLEKWDWPTVSEIMLARLEGSRRSLKGGVLEEIVREAFRTCLLAHRIAFNVGGKQCRIHDQTYDVQLVGKNRTILVPVKTRETMGGGHANLFTRDITEAIRVAHDSGNTCIPVVIAESWHADMTNLGCQDIISLRLNPNQSEEVKAQLSAAIAALAPKLRDLAN